MTSAPAWPDVDIAGALELIRTGDLSVVNLLEAHLTRIGALDGVIHAVITATAETARQAAREIDARGRLDQPGSLSGIPIGIKDNFETAAVRTTAATKALAGQVPRRSAVVVDRLRRAGALSIGKLNMDELALGGPSGSDVGGIMVNPWDGIGSPG